MTYFSLTMSFIEESAAAFGMEAQDAGRLRLASEEIFTYLAEYRKGEALSVETEDGCYYVGVKFLLHADPDSPPPHLPERGPGPLEPGDDLASMGLIIASRFVDRLHMLEDGGVGLVKEKTYPEAGTLVRTPVPALARFHVAAPENEALKHFVRQVAAYYGPQFFPVDFCFPGKVVDMVAQGQYRVLVATGGGAEVAGGIMWRTEGARLIEAFGPYLFDQPPQYGMSEALVDGLLMEIAKTEAFCVTDIYPTPELPHGYFELLGSIDRIKPDGLREARLFYYRQLKEDPGLSVWAHPDLVSFLEQEYERLFLARHIRVTTGGGEARPAHAFFSLRFDRVLSSAILRLLWDGADAREVLENHVKSLRAEGFSDIFFEMDLAHTREVDLTPLLFRQGFAPRLVFPHGGGADMVAFQYQG
jgi:hypothetical protein